MADDSTNPQRLTPAQSAAESSAAKAGRLLWPGGLSARLLIFTVIFVALAELSILAASLATFEERWLSDRITRADLALLTFEVAPDGAISGAANEKLKERSGVTAIAAQIDGVRWSYVPPADIEDPYAVDLRAQNFLDWLSAPLRTLTSGKDRYVRVVDNTPSFAGDDFLEIVAPDEPLKQELLRYLWGLLGLTILISAGAGALVFLFLNAFLVRPMQRITLAMERFRADPDDPEATIPPSGRRDEIGRAEAELSRMQADLRIALNSRARLAALGEAVAKINHDLRNMLTSAQMASERLALSGDPSVAQAMPRLERALDRAARLTTEVLAYGKSEEPVPHPVTVRLKDAVTAAVEDAGLERAGVKLVTNLRATDRIIADPDHLHRILVNLIKNARQAVSGPDRRKPGTIRLTLAREGGASIIAIADDGPGVPAKARENLFQPFTGSGRAGGTGLGLAIARELAQAHGGDVSLKSSGPEGSMFEVVLPGAPDMLPSAASQRASSRTTTGRGKSTNPA